MVFYLRDKSLPISTCWVKLEPAYDESTAACWPQTQSRGYGTGLVKREAR